MNETKSVAQWLTEKNLSREEFMAAIGLERKVIEAILHGRYTPSPQQRRRVAEALDIAPEQIAWGHVHEVSHVYGHGPQFGRSP